MFLIGLHMLILAVFSSGGDASLCRVVVVQDGETQSKQVGDTFELRCSGICSNRTELSPVRLYSAGLQHNVQLGAILQRKIFKLQVLNFKNSNREMSCVYLCEGVDKVRRVASEFVCHDDFIERRLIVLFKAIKDWTSPLQSLSTKSRSKRGVRSLSSMRKKKLREFKVNGLSYQNIPKRSHRYKMPPQLTISRYLPRISSQHHSQSNKRQLEILASTIQSKSLPRSNRNSEVDREDVSSDFHFAEPSPLPMFSRIFPKVVNEHRRFQESTFHKLLASTHKLHMRRHGFQHSAILPKNTKKNASVKGDIQEKKVKRKSSDYESPTDLETQKVIETSGEHKVSNDFEENEIKETSGEYNIPTDLKEIECRELTGLNLEEIDYKESSGENNFPIDLEQHEFKETSAEYNNPIDLEESEVKETSGEYNIDYKKFDYKESSGENNFPIDLEESEVKETSGEYNNPIDLEESDVKETSGEYNIDYKKFDYKESSGENNFPIDLEQHEFKETSDEYNNPIDLEESEVKETSGEYNIDFKEIDYKELSGLNLKKIDYKEPLVEYNIDLEESEVKETGYNKHNTRKQNAKYA